MRLCNSEHMTIESFGSWSILHHPEATRMIAVQCFLNLQILVPGRMLL